MPPYSKRYAGGFVDKPSLTTAIDATFLNAVEAALLALFGVAPATNGALVWNGTQFTAANKLTNANIDAAAAIAKSKLDLAGQIVDADIAGSAAISRSKLNLTAQIQRADMAAGNKVTVSAFSGGPPGSPSDDDIWIATNVESALTFGASATENSSSTRWMFQYDSSQPTYKWVFVGGNPVTSRVDNGQSPASSGSFVDLAIVGPLFSGLRAGDYWIEWGAWMTARTDSTVGQSQTGLFRASDNGSIGTPVIATQGSASTGASGYTGDIVAIAAGDGPKLRYNGAMTSSTFAYRVLKAIPRRII